MIDIATKINNDPTSAGAVEDFEYNDTFRELSNAVEPYLVLDGQDEKQLAKSIDIASKAMFYGDIGTVNSVILTRGATSEQIETLVDGIVVIFSVANQNTGASTLKLNALTPKAILYNGLPLIAGMLKVGFKYIAIYSLSDDSFKIDLIAVTNTPNTVFGFDSSGVPVLKDDVAFGDPIQTLNNVTASRIFNTNYPNTTDRTIQVIITVDVGTEDEYLYINNISVMTINDGSAGGKTAFAFLVPKGWLYRISGGVGDNINNWFEISEV